MASAQIESVRIDHNMLKDHDKGMNILVAFAVHDLRGNQGQVAAYFELLARRPFTRF
jgi:hypothetical protein